MASGNFEQHGGGDLFSAEDIEKLRSLAQPATRKVSASGEKGEIKYCCQNTELPK